MKKPSMQLNIALSTLYRVLLMITPLITAPYTARVLGVDGVGINSFTTSVQSYFTLLAGLGTYTYGSREIARNRDNREKRSQLFWEIELLTLITTMVCLLGWVAVILLGGEYRTYYLILAVSLAATFFEISWFFAGMERFDHTVVINTGLKILTIVAVFLFVKTPAHLPRFMLISALGTLLGNFSMWLFLPQYIQKPDFKNLRIWRHFKETLIYFIPSVATSVYTVLDKTLINLITQSNAQNGYYEQATKIINMAKSVGFVALNSVMGSRMSYLHGQNNQEEIFKRTGQSVDYISFMGAGMAFGLIAVAPRFVMAFFGPDYGAVVPLLQIFSPIILVIGISNCLDSHYYTPAGQRKRGTIYLVCGAAVNLILNCILIPTYGSMGAATASVIAELVISFLYIRGSKGFITFGYLWQFLWRKLIAAVVMVLAIRLMDDWFVRPIIAILCQVPVGVAIYCLVLLALRDNAVVIITQKVWAVIKTKILKK